jgi:hypothetical protein
LALADAGRIGRAEDDDRIIARGGWALRRLTTARADLATYEAVLDFLGRLSQPDPTEADGDSLLPLGPSPTALSGWLAAVEALSHAHPLTRAGAALHLWRGFALSETGAVLEPAVLAACLAGEAGRGGLAAIPLAAAPAGLRAAGTVSARLAGWYEALAAGVDRAQLMLDQTEDWAARAVAALSDLSGKGAPALIALVTARPILSARDVAEELSVTPTQARSLLNRIEARGVIHEMTGHRRFRFWTARL